MSFSNSCPVCRMVLCPFSCKQIMSRGCVQTFASCVGPRQQLLRVDEGPRADFARLLCLCTGRNFPEVDQFSSIRASRAWSSARLGSSRNSTVPSVGFLTLRWSKILESPGKLEKTAGKKKKRKKMLRAARVSPSCCLSSSLTSAGRDDGSGSVNTLLFHLMPGVACEQGRDAALLVALLLQR